MSVMPHKRMLVSVNRNQVISLTFENVPVFPFEVILSELSVAVPVSSQLTPAHPSECAFSVPKISDRHHAPIKA